MLLDVMPGDELDLEVWAYNEGGISTGTSRIASADLVSALVGAFVPNGSGTELHTQTNSIFTGVSGYLTGGGGSGSTTPFAFLNYIVFDNNFNRVASGHQRVSSVLNAKHLLTLSNINITQKGYVYIWVSNESNENKNTYFDDLKVTHAKGSILQEDHYYPFGMNIQALSSNAPLSKPNKFKIQGKELQSEFDLNWYDFGARNYDPTIARWTSVDPMSDVLSHLSPYNYVENNPLSMIDPDGRLSTHTDEEGNVVAVFDDGDNGVYQHEKNADGGSVTEYQLSKRAKKQGTSSGGKKMGETLHTFSFVDGAELEKGNIVPTGKIDFESTWAQDKVQGVLDGSYGIIHYGINARSGKKFDIKLDAVKEGKAGGIYNGSLIHDGVYASARDAGNFAAGAKGDRSFLSNKTITYGYGAYNAGENNVRRTLFTIGYDMIIRASGGNKGYLQAPNYGEDRQSYLGINAGMKNSNWFKK